MVKREAEGSEGQEEMVGLTVDELARLGALRMLKGAEVLPMLSRRGWSTGDVRDARPVRLGEEAAGLSPTTITRLAAAWETAYPTFHPRDLRARDDVDIWGDGVHFTIRLEDARLCTLVVMGTRADGTKEVMAVEDGYRESTESWLTIWRDRKRRGMTAPAVAVRGGAREGWTAVGEVWPETREPRGWVHRLANGLDTWPKRLPPRATRALREIMNAATRGDAEAAITAFTAADQAKDPQAVASLERAQEKRLTCVDVPAEHGLHWRTTNPVESPFSTGRWRPRGTKGAGSRAKGLVMADTLLVMAEERWRQRHAPHLLPLVQAKVTCVDGIQQRRNEEEGGKEAA
jgi:putative transposase